MLTSRERLVRETALVLVLLSGPLRETPMLWIGNPRLELTMWDAAASQAHVIPVVANGQPGLMIKPVATVAKLELA